MLRVAIYRSLRIAAPLILISQVIIRILSPNPAILPDLVLYNLVGLLASFIALTSPAFNDRFARVIITGAIVLWTIGSTFSTWNSFYDFQLLPTITDYNYALFYPLMLAGILRALSINKKILSLELLDTVIIALGASSVIASFLLRPAMLHLDGPAFSVFLSILYPTGDIVLVAITVALVTWQPRTARSLLLLCGILLFAITDLYYLLQSTTSSYSMVERLKFRSE